MSEAMIAHDKAMELLEQAFVARREDRHDEAHGLYERAWCLETTAASLLPIGDTWRMRLNKSADEIIKLMEEMNDET